MPGDGTTMKLTPKTKIHDLIDAYPFLVEFLVAHNPSYKPLQSKLMRATVGRMATLSKVASLGSENLADLMKAIAAEVDRQKGEKLVIETSAPVDEAKVAEMKSIISDLHDGAAFEESKKRFDELAKDVDPGEIARMEEELIKGGMPVTEVQRLCDLHVGVFKDGLEETEDAEAPPGHPVHTYMAENERLSTLADELTAILSGIEQEPGKLEREKSKVKGALDAIAPFESHYIRKENQLFPVLEKHGVTGPSQVMWGVHDEIREHVKKTRGSLDARDARGLVEHGTAFARGIVEMIYKENKILFPLALSHLLVEEWAALRRGDDELGYAFDGPAAPWPAGEEVAAAPVASSGLFDLHTGKLSLEQLDLLMTHLPVDLSFVDENDEVRYYSEGPARIFPRSPAVIGRKVQNCHPPNSVHIVEKLLGEFKKGNKDVAEFWIQLGERFIHIRYFAVRDAGGRYRGCLEVSQDLTSIRKLEGQKRLLDWDD